MRTIQTISLLTLALLAGTASASSELISNSTFQTSAFNSDYLIGGDPYAVSTANIGASPRDFHSAWTDFHSEFGANMLIVNGGVDASQAVWSQSVNLSAGSSYNFLLSAASTYSGSPAKLDVTATYGATTVDLGTLQLGSTPGQWQTFNNTVSLGYTGAVTFKLLDQNTAPSGNDFAVDKVSLTAAVPEPETYAMLLAGLGLMGFIARRRKSA